MNMKKTRLTAIVVMFMMMLVVGGGIVASQKLQTVSEQLGRNLLIHGEVYI